MATRSRDFVGVAEGIKSHEISTKGRIEQLKGRISELSSQKSSLNGRISYLESAIAAAYEDTDEDGEPDYALIASLESQMASAENELSQVEQDLDTTGGELAHSENELQGVLENKAQTLFEIQERARKTSSNMSLAGGMYGAYAGVGSSLQSSMQTSLSALSQAAGILGGSVDSGVSGGSSGGSGGAHGSGSSGQTHSDLSSSPLAAFSGGNSGSSVLVSNPSPSQFSSSQTEHSTPGTLPNFHSGQSTINAQKPLNFNSDQRANLYATSSFGESDSTESEMSLAEGASKFQSSQQSSHLEQNIHGSSSKETKGKGKYTMNTPRTVEHMRSQMSKAGQEYFDSAIAAGGGIGGQRAHLQGAGEAMYMTSSSTGSASGNFLTKEHPGSTPQDRKTNLQLPPNNDAARVERIYSVKPTVILSSIAQAQPQWAEKGGYTAQQGVHQVFTPNKSINGAIAAGIYKVGSGGSVHYLNVSKNVSDLGGKNRITFKSFFSKIKQQFVKSPIGNLGQKMKALYDITSNNIDESINKTLSKVAVNVLKKSFGDSFSKEMYSDMHKRVKVLTENEIRSQYPGVNAKAIGFYHEKTKEIIIRKGSGVPIVSLTSHYVHEMLHGLSHSNMRVGVVERYIESGQEYSRHIALNEGLTEYYTKKAMDSDGSIELTHISYPIEVEIAKRLEYICGEKTLMNAFAYQGIEAIRRDFDNEFSKKGSFDSFSDKLDDLHDLVYIGGKSVDNPRVQRIRNELMGILDEYEKLKKDSGYRFKKSIKTEVNDSFSPSAPPQHPKGSDTYKEERQRTIYGEGHEL